MARNEGGKMKLRNKKTGEIIDLNKGSITDVGLGSKIQLQATDRYNKPIWVYNSLAELNEAWEDVPEEPKEYWRIDCDGEIVNDEYEGKRFDKDCKKIGNYFETQEEAEKVVEKLKAWKRLKDKGIKIIDYECCGGVSKKGEFLGEVKVAIDVPQDVDKYLFETLFGGEE